MRKYNTTGMPKQLRKWLTKTRSAKQGTDPAKFYEACQKLAEDAGMPDMFDQIDFQEISDKKTKEITVFRKKFGRYPSEASENKAERQMGQWLNQKRHAKRIGSTIFYPSCQKIAEEAGLPDMFDRIDLQQVANGKTKKIAIFRTKFGRYPSASSKNKEEKQLSNWLFSMRQSKRIGSDVFYPSCQKIAEEAGLPDMFDNINFAQIADNNTIKIVAWQKKFGRYPSASSKNKEEKRLATWLSNIRKTKQKNGGVYPSCQKIADEAGLPNMFDVTDRQQIADDQTRKVVALHTKFDRYPSMHSKDIAERQLSQWLNQRRRAKQKKGDNIFYPSCQKIAEEAGLPDMFDNHTPTFIKFAAARKWCIENDIKGVMDYKSRYKEHGNLPASPDAHYAAWKGWKHFLGKG